MGSDRYYYRQERPPRAEASAPIHLISTSLSKLKRAWGYFCSNCHIPAKRHFQRRNSLLFQARFAYRARNAAFYYPDDGVSLLCPVYVDFSGVQSGVRISRGDLRFPRRACYRALDMSSRNPPRRIFRGVFPIHRRLVASGYIPPHGFVYPAYDGETNPCCSLTEAPRSGIEVFSLANLRGSGNAQSNLHSGTGRLLVGDLSPPWGLSAFTKGYPSAANLAPP